MTIDYDWTKFMCRVTINSPIEKIYEAWTKAALLEKWFLPEAVFIAAAGGIRNKDESFTKGDNYQWCRKIEGKNQKEAGTILEANGRDQVQFEFTADSFVTVIIKSEAGENVVELWEENLPRSDTSKFMYHLKELQQWTFYLSNLKCFLECGLDLRNKNPELENLINN